MAVESTFPSEQPSSGGSPGWQRGLLWTLAVAAVALVVIAGVGTALWWYAEQRLDREVIPALDKGDDDAETEFELDAPLTFLVVGSDSRDDLTEEERRDLRLGTFEHEQADTILIVQILPGADRANVVSIPRDLRIIHDGRSRRINAMLDIGGADLVVRTVEHIAGIQVDHYINVSVMGFVKVVDAVGTVEICLDEPLHDEKSGADFTAGCHDMDGAEALSYVRSREGPRGDFERIERQHTFISAVMSEMTSARTLVDVRRLFRIIDAGAPHVTTDEKLGLRQMRRLAEELRGVVDGEVETTVLPAFAEQIGDVPYMIAFEPGAREIFAALRRGDSVPPRGDSEEREETTVGIWTGHHAIGADRVASTLHFAGFAPAGQGPGAVEAGRQSIVFDIGDSDAAQWVAGLLGAAIHPLPDDVDAPEDVDVLVLVGEDAEFAID
jgi:LCP family protein required for cell wall assembly